MKSIIHKTLPYLLSLTIAASSALSLAAPVLASETSAEMEEECLFLLSEDETQPLFAEEEAEGTPETFEIEVPAQEAETDDELFEETAESIEEFAVFEANASGSGTIGTLTWTLNNGVLTISGNGPMSVGSPAPWMSYKASISQVVIGNGVTSISSYAFNNCPGISKLTIGNSVKTIGYAAFSGCTGLTSLTIPASVESLGENAFSSCKGLRELNLNNGLKKIGTAAFSYCYPLREVTIPDSVTTINSSAFSGCSALTEILIPDSVTDLDFSAFNNCTSLKKAVLGKNLSKISSGLFQNCSALTSISMPDSITVIEGNAFRDCISLRSISLSKNLTTIGSDSFYNCKSLTSVVIPDHVTQIGGGAFGSCSSLSVVSLPASLSQIGVNSFYGTSLETVFYSGTPSDWNIMTISSGNAPLLNAERIYGTLKLSAPKISITSVAKSGKPKLGWNKVTGAGSYLIYRAASKSGTYKHIKTVTGTSYTDTAAAVNNTYYYKVKARMSSGTTSSFSNIAGKTCKCARPEITVKLNSKKKAVVSWKSISGARSYTVYRATSKTGTYKAVKTLTGKSWTDTSVTKGKTYYYKVRANGSKSAANSANSTVKGITVK